MSKGIFIVFVLLVILALSYKGYRYIKHKIVKNDVAIEYINKPAPKAEGIDIKGKRFVLDAHRGKNVIIIFWATWCKYCVKEIPTIIDFQNTLGNTSDTVVVSSILDTDIEKAKVFIDKNKINYTVLIDEQYYGADSEFNKPFKIVNIPSIWVINKEGIVVGQNLHHITEAIEILR